MDKKRARMVKLVFLLLGIIIGMFLSPRSMEWKFGTNDHMHGPTMVGTASARAKAGTAGGFVIKKKTN